MERPGEKLNSACRRPSNTGGRLHVVTLGPHTEQFHIVPILLDGLTNCDPICNLKPVSPLSAHLCTAVQGRPPTEQGIHP